MRTIKMRLTKFLAVAGLLLWSPLAHAVNSCGTDYTAEGKLMVGVDSTCTFRQLNTDTNGDMIVVTTSGGGALTVIGTTPQGTAKGNELQVAPIVFETTPTTLSNNQTGPAEADNKGRTIVVGAAAIAAAAAGNPVQIGSQDINANMQVPDVDFSGQNYTSLFPGVGQDAPYGMQVTGYDFGASGRGTVRAVPVTLDTESLTSTPRAIPIAGADSAATRVARIPTVVPVGSAVSTTAPLFVMGGEDDSTAGAGNARAVTVGVSGTAFGGTTPTVVELGGMDSTVTNGKAQVLSVIPSGSTTGNTLNLAMVGGKDGSSNAVAMPIPAIGVQTTSGGISVQGTTTDALAAAVEPNPVPMGGWQNNGGSATIRSLAVAPNATAVTLANTNGLVVAGNGNGTIYDLSATPVGTAVTTTQNVLAIGGEDDSTAGAGNAREITVAASGTAFGGTTPTVLEIGGMDSTVTNGVPRVLSVIPVAATTANTLNLDMIGGVDGGNAARTLPVAVNASAIPLNTLQVGGSDGTNERPLPIAASGNATPFGGVAIQGTIQDATGSVSEPDPVLIAGWQTGASATIRGLAAAPNGTAFATPNALVIAGYDGAATRTATISPNNTAITGTGNVLIVGGADSGSKSQALGVSVAGAAASSDDLMIGAKDTAGNAEPPRSDTSGRLIPTGESADGAAVVGNAIVIGGVQAGGGLVRTLHIVPVGTAVAATANGAVIIGEDDTTAGAGNARALTVATSGTAFSGTTPTVLEIGGMDTTATNGVPRVLSVIPGGNTATTTADLAMIGGRDSAGLAQEVRMTQGLASFNAGEVETADSLDMAIAAGAPTTTSLTASMSVSVASAITANSCWELICGVDVNYRITAGASTAVATDFLLPAKTTLSRCTNVANASITVFPSATLSNGCNFNTKENLP